MKKVLNLDVLGIGASFLCLLHCICLPWLISLLGVYLKPFVSSTNFHNVMLTISVLIGVPVFVISFARHKSKRVLIFGLMGLSLTVFGTMQDDECCPVLVEELTCESEHEACGECPSEGLLEIEKESTQRTVSETAKQGFNVLPLGICVLISAHFMNFKKRNHCKNNCCT